jgi:hypothetical protein
MLRGWPNIAIENGHLMPFIVDLHIYSFISIRAKQNTKKHDKPSKEEERWVWAITIHHTKSW